MYKTNIVTVKDPKSYIIGHRNGMNIRIIHVIQQVGLLIVNISQKEIQLI